MAGLAQVSADALIVWWAPVSATVLDAAPSGRFIGALGIGYHMIGVAAATERSVAVANTPGYWVDLTRPSATTGLGNRPRSGEKHHLYRIC
jgi:D-3-phosphoglycerate dehydrogenase / 2-oxoglutarate reductase